MRSHRLLIGTLLALAAVAFAGRTTSTPTEEFIEVTRLQGTKPAGATKPTSSGTNPKYYTQPRVRREIRDLSESELDKLVNAYWTLKNTSTAEGRKIYGPKFNNHDDMLFLHSCATNDPRCDQGHYGPQFMTFHRAMLLKYELALLSVEPTIGAMPYWDMSLDSTTGKYFNDKVKGIFTDTYFGDYYGKPEENYVVTNGRFAYWPIAEYTKDKFGSTSPIASPTSSDYAKCAEEEDFKGYEATTCERCCNVEDCVCDQDTDTYKHWLRAHDECTPYVLRKPKEMIPFGGTFDLVYTADNFDQCTDIKDVPTWMAWQNCVEVSAFQCLDEVVELFEKDRVVPQWLEQTTSQLDGSQGKYQTGDQTKVGDFLVETEGSMKVGDAKSKQKTLDEIKTVASDLEFHEKCKIMYTGYAVTDKRTNKRAHPPAFHSQVHVKLGMGSELQDVTTSPNEGGLFTTYHADIDRNNFIWTDKMVDAKLDLGYPTAAFDKKKFTSQNPAPYGTSGPYSVYDYLMCNNDAFPEYDTSEPWLKGTTADEVLLSRYPFHDLFECNNPMTQEEKDNNCDGRQNGQDGYSHAELLYWTHPSRTPYTYDTLASNYAI